MNCLIVDDSRTIRRILKGILDELGMRCTEAEDGLMARDMCAQEMPDLIFLDWNMPNMTGIEFLRTLRSMDKGAGPKVIFCTTENSFEFIQNGLNSGADEYVMKPFDRTIIQSKLVQLGILAETF